jgi:hypothetical protein
MKQTIKCLFLSMMLGISFFVSNAQDTKKVFASDVPIVYLGIDFTPVKVINDVATTPTDIKNRHFEGINQVVIAETKKYDWQKALDKSNLSNDLSIVSARNEKVDETKISSTSTADESRLKADDIKKIISNYNFDGKKGVGLVLIMEALSKTSENGAMWVTFIDMNSKKVLLTERMVGKAQGFGFRNFYAYTVYKVIQDIKKNKLSEWRSKYGS